VVLAHPGKVRVGLVGHHGLDLVRVANLDKIGNAHLGVVHRDDDATCPFHGGGFYLRFVHVSDREPERREAGDTDKSNIERKALQGLDSERSHETTAGQAVLAAEHAVADTGHRSKDLGHLEGVGQDINVDRAPGCGLGDSASARAIIVVPLSMKIASPSLISARQARAIACFPSTFVPARADTLAS
jgi:hypothetical protein